MQIARCPGPRDSPRWPRRQPPGSRSLPLQAARRPRPPHAGLGPRSAAAPRPMPTRGHPRPRGPRGSPQTRPPGPGPPRSVPPRGHKTSARRPRCQPQPGARRKRPKKIVFEDELPSQSLLEAKKSAGADPGGRTPRPQPVPDYVIKYPAVSSGRDRSRYAAVFQDQYGEFLELRQAVATTQAKLQQLEALLSSLPPPRSQEEARVAERVWKEFQKKQADPGFLDRQARCHYLKGKLTHLKTQIQKFDDHGDSEGSVYF